MEELYRGVYLDLFMTMDMLFKSSENYKKK